MSIAGESVGRIHSGPDGFTSQRSDWPTTPGPGTGADSAVVTHPALPAEAARPHRSRSITVTPTPRVASASATHSPTAPPPTTTADEVKAQIPLETDPSDRAGTGPCR